MLICYQGWCVTKSGYITAHSLYYYLGLDVRFHPHIYKVCPGWVVSEVWPSICSTSWVRVVPSDPLEGPDDPHSQRSGQIQGIPTWWHFTLQHLEFQDRPHHLHPELIWRQIPADIKLNQAVWKYQKYQPGRAAENDIHPGFITCYHCIVMGQPDVIFRCHGKVATDPMLAGRTISEARLTFWNRGLLLQLPCFLRICSGSWGGSHVMGKFPATCNWLLWG